MRLSKNDLLPNTQYALRVRAVGDDRVSEWSSRLIFTTDSDNVSPSVPTSVTWVSTGDSFHGEWNAVTTNVGNDPIVITRYEVELMGGGNTRIDSVTASTGAKVVYDLSLEANRALFGSPQGAIELRVRAVDNKNLKSAWSEPISASNPRPSNVTNVTGTVGVDQINLRWDPVNDTDLVRYEVYVGFSSTFTPGPLNLVFSGLATSFTHTTTTYAEHFFKVRAVDKFEQASLVDAVSAGLAPISPFAFDATPPEEPTGVSLTTTYDNTRKQAKLTLAWTPPDDDDLQNFTVRYGPAATGPWNYVSVDKDAATVDIPVTPGLVYHTGIRAVDFSGNLSNWAPVTNSPITAGADSTPPVQVTGLSASSQGTSFIATWNASADNDLKEYEIGALANSTEVYYKTTATRFDLNFEMNRAAFNGARTSVQFRVRAIDIGGLIGPWSTTVTPTNPAPSPPTALVNSLGANAITVRWTPPVDNDLIGYNIYQGTSANPSTKVGFIDGTAYTTTANTTGQYFSIKSVDAFLQESSALSGGPFTATNPFLVDTTAPAVPGTLAATLTNNANGVGSRAAVSWTLGAETDRAYVELSYKRSADSSWTSSVLGKDQLNTIVQLAYANTGYDFRIRSVDTSGNGSAFSSTLSKPAVSATAPSVPTGLSATPGRDSIVWRWTPNTETDLKNYEFVFSTTSGFTGGTTTTFYTGTTNTLTVAGLNPNTNYWGQLRATNQAGLSSAMSSVVASGTTSFPQANPSDGVAPTSSPTPSVASGLGYLYLTWAPTTNPDPVTYEVHLSTTTGFTPSASTKALEVSGTFALLDVLPGTSTGLIYSNTYYVKLIAKDRDGAASPGTEAYGSPARATGEELLLDGAIGAREVATDVFKGKVFSVGTGGFIQSELFSSTQGFRISETGIELNDANSTVKAEAISAGTLGGPSGSGTINIALGTSLVMNGGEIRSNTYSANAGFKISTDGIELNDDNSKVTVGALQTGIFDAATMTIGAAGFIESTNYNATNRTGWRLGSTGLNLFDGTINARALNISIGGNNMYTNSSFDNEINYLEDWNITYPEGVTKVAALGSGFGAQVVARADFNDCVYRDVTGLIPGQPYTFSAWVYVRTGSAFINGHNTTGANQTADTVSSTYNAWQRLSQEYVADSSGAFRGHVWASPGSNIVVDDVQFEMGNIATSYAPKTDEVLPGTIQGDMVKANSMDAGILKADTAINQNLNVTSSLVMGTANAPTAGLIRSYAYTTGSVGWQIQANGTAEFNDVTVRGNIQGNSSSKFTGGIFTAGIFQTNDTNNSVIRIHQAGIFANNAAGGVAFSVDGVTGNQTIAGTTTVSGNTALNGTLTVGGGITLNGPIGSSYIRSSDGHTSSGSASGTGYILDANGLYVGSGSRILAGALEIQTGGGNIVNASNMEGSNALTESYNGATSITYDTTTSAFGSTSLRVVPGGFSRGVIIWSKPMASNNVITANQKIVGSIWFRGVSGASYYMAYRVRNASSSYLTEGGGRSFSASGLWQRIVCDPFSYSSVYIPGVQIYQTSGTTSSPFYVDGVQIELGDVETSYAASTTNIDGSQVSTGTVRSSTLVTIDGVPNQPQWSIDLQGDARFANLRVLGNSIVGNSTGDTSSVLKSANYSSGGSGWQVSSSGTSEFGNATLRGSVATNIATGPRMELKNVGTVGTLSMYTETANETTPGSISMVTVSAGTLNERSTMTIKTAKLLTQYSSNGVDVPEITLESGTNFGPNNSLVNLRAESIRFKNNLDTNYMEFDNGILGYYNNAGTELPFTLKRLRVSSTSAATTNPGNQPPMIIGNFQNTHLRIDNDGIISMGNDTTKKRFSITSNDVYFQLGQGSVVFEGGTNISNKMRTNTGTGTSLVLKSNQIVAATEQYDAVTNTASNTVTFIANEIRTEGGFFDAAQAGNGVNAQYNSAGRIVKQGSSLRYKHDVEELDFDVAKNLLSVKPKTFIWNEEFEMGSQRVPGFIAEDADAAGATLWVTYDTQGRPDGIRYQEITVAHHALIQRLYRDRADQNERVEALEAERTDLVDRLERLEAAVSAMGG